MQLYCIFIISATICCVFFQINATTHFIVTKEGMIQPQIDSPYYLRRPNDLIAFLNQSKCKSTIDSLFEELMTIKKDLMFKMNHIDKFTAEFMWQYQTKCVSSYFLKVEDLYSTISSSNYIDRINQLMKNELPPKKGNSAVPRCHDFIALNYSMFTFEHLKAMKQRHNATMDPELELNANNLALSDTNFPIRLASALRAKPTSWKLHTLGSYYWRYKGKATNAIECARRALYFAPRKQKDIPLLSLGTIFQRAQNNLDAIIVFNAAVDHGVEYAENHFALANSLFLLSDFGRSLQYYDVAVILDDSFKERVHFIKKSLTCFKYVKRRLISMEGILDEMLSELEKFAARKKILEECHDKLVKEQVPLGLRYNESPHLTENNFLAQRSQYCSTRIDDDSTEPILFCDFFSDIQMRMKLKVIAIDLINNYVERTNDLIKRHLESSLGVFKYLDLIDDGTENIDDIESDL